MQICILHHISQEVKFLREVLEGRKMEVTICTWEDAVVWNAAPLWGCNALLIYLNGPELPNSLMEIRQIHRDIPIVVLDFNTEKSLASREWSLKNGADSYMAPPFSINEVESEIKKLIAEKKSRQKAKIVRAFDVLLDLTRHIARRREKDITLRNKEFSLLEFFIMNRGQVLSRDTILEHVWDRNGTFASNTVDVHVNRLRRKLDDPFREKLIHTVYCVGYIFEKRKKTI